MIGYGWRQTRDLNVAAAIATCGIKVIPVSTLDEPTGRRITSFHLRDRGHLPAAVIPQEDTHRIRDRFNIHHGPAEAWDMESGILRQSLESHTLEAADPAHPAIDALLTLHARECLITFMKRGTRYRLERHPTAPRAKYVEGQEPMVARMGQPDFPTWTTRDTALAACMARIGCPVLTITGTAPHRTYVLPRFGHQLAGRVLIEDAQEIARLLLTGDLARHCPEHPAVWGFAACRARLILLKAIEQKGAHSQVLLRHDRSSAWQQRRRSALVEERAPSAALDSALIHLRG